MPITGPNSYLQTSQEFLNHWDMVNQAQPTPLVLLGGITRAKFAAMVEEMSAAFAAIVPASSHQRSASADLALKREALVPQITQFGKAVRYYLSKTRFADAAPRVPSPTMGEQSFRDAIEVIAVRWSEINAATDLAPFTPPLQWPLPTSTPGAPGNYTLADFEAQGAEVLAAFAEDKRAGEIATQKRRDRDALLPAIYDVMKSYREAVVLLLPADSPLRATLPRLSPAPGSTPSSLAVSGFWEPQVLEARLSWPATTQANVDKLQVRACAGSYKEEDEQIVDDLDADATSWQGNWGLTAPGAIATFKVYVMTTTGNENGGKAVKIVRPVT
jgi:hypothetical protein